MVTTCSHNEDWPDVTRCNADLAAAYNQNC